MRLFGGFPCPAILRAAVVPAVILTAFVDHYLSLLILISSLLFVPVQLACLSSIPRRFMGAAGAGARC